MSQIQSQTGGSCYLTVKQSLWPLFLIFGLCSFCGFAGGIIEVLNKFFQVTLNLSRKDSAGIQIAFFGAYAIGPLTYSGWILRRFGYRHTIIISLVAFGVGALMFLPSALHRSFGGFCAATFIMGSASAIGDLAILPFVAICGPPKWSEVRSNLIYAFGSMSGVCALVFAGFVIYKNNDKAQTSLVIVKWISISVGCGCIILAIAFCFVKLPEISDSDMAAQAEESRARTNWVDKPLYRQYTLFWGVLAVFFYAGAQTAVGAFLINFITEVDDRLSNGAAAHRLAIAQSLFCVGRFLSALLLRFIKPRWLLLAAMSSTIVFLGIATFVPGRSAATIIMLEFFTKAPIFPTIFSISLRGLGRHTKIGASFLVTALCGGAVFSPALGALADSEGTQLAMVIPLAANLIGLSFPVYLNLFKGKELDALGASDSPEPAERVQSDSSLESVQKDEVTMSPKAKEESV